MPSGHLNAMRFDQRPLPQPAYSFVHVPRAKSTLENSSLQRIENREAFQTCMAEMLLLSKEAVRRRKNIPIVDPVVTNSGAKPLSLEYLADRMDIDEVSWFSAGVSLLLELLLVFCPTHSSARLIDSLSLVLATWSGQTQNQRPRQQQLKIKTHLTGRKECCKAL